MRCPHSAYRRFLTMFTAALAAIVGAGVALIAAEPITVELRNGHTLTGEADSQTDARLLWIRREETGVQLTSGFPWTQILRVRRGQDVFPGRDFFALTQNTTAQNSTIQNTISPGKTYEQIPSAPVPAEPLPEPITTSVARSRVGEELWRQAAQKRVNTLYIEAYLANWDGDPQTDGLRVFVYPLAADGELVPVNGQIDLFLLGEIERATGITAPPQMPQFRELDRRSHLVRPTDFARGAATYELPFRQFHPDFYFDVARQALVTARLGVPGQGLFIASDANVQLRGFSRIRDELQMQTRQRFFQQENAIERDAAPPPLPLR